MIPVITILALQMGSLFSGALITEQVFAYLGMGKTIYDEVIGNDYNVALIGLLLATLTMQLTNLVADLAYSWTHPRVSYAYASATHDDTRSNTRGTTRPTPTPHPRHHET